MRNHFGKGPEFWNRATLLKVQARLLDANVIGEGQELQVQDLLDDVLMEIHALLDERRLHEFASVGLAHRDAERDIDRADVGPLSPRLDAEDDDLLLGTGDGDAEGLLQVSVEGVEEGLFRDVGDAQRDRVLEHGVGDVVDLQLQVGPDVVLAVGDHHAHLGPEVHIRLDQRGQPDLAGPMVEHEEVGVVAVGEVVGEVRGGISVPGRHSAEDVELVLVGAGVVDDLEVLELRLIVVGVLEVDDDVGVGAEGRALGPDADLVLPSVALVVKLFLGEERNAPRLLEFAEVEVPRVGGVEQLKRDLGVLPFVGVGDLDLADPRAVGTVLFEVESELIAGEFGRRIVHVKDVNAEHHLR